MTFLKPLLIGYSEVEARKILYRDGYTDDQIEIIEANTIITLQSRPPGTIMLFLNDANVVTEVW